VAIVGVTVSDISDVRDSCRFSIDEEAAPSLLVRRNGAGSVRYNPFHGRDGLVKFELSRTNVRLTVTRRATIIRPIAEGASGG
jgi:hypothetical protein